MRQAIAKKLRFQILNKFNFTCQYCGKKSPYRGGNSWLHIDHKIPVDAGGTNDPENLTVSCSDCNVGKGASVTDEFKQYIKPRRSISKGVPVGKDSKMINLLRQWETICADQIDLYDYTSHFIYEKIKECEANDEKHLIRFLEC